MEGKATMARSSCWIQSRGSDQRPSLRLFCFPHAGGGASAFHAWNIALGQAIQVCAVALPGRETRLREPLFSEFGPLLDAIDSQLAPWLDLPFAVLGHSMGALLAFEWVRKLKHARKAEPVRLILSGRRAPNISPDTDLLHTLPDAEFLQELSARYEGMSQELMTNPELIEVYLPILRADISIVESYRFQESEPLSCPMLVFAGIDDKSLTFEQLVAWKRHTTGSFAAHLLPGGHFFPAAPLLQNLAEAFAGMVD
jgi:medium-chain acyl-[acyl-carrier-protein] hydrolase